MRARRRARFIVLGGAVVVLLAVAAGPALATITPPGNCEGTGVFTPQGEGTNPRSAASSGTITIPQKADVRWTGSVNIPMPDDPRPTRGWVALELPAGQTVTIGEWNSSGVMIANSDNYNYDVPAVIAGFPMTFSGEHYEKGVLFCKGSVTIEVEGTNPLGIPTVALTVFSFVGSYLTIRQRPQGPTVVSEYRKGEVI